MKSESNHSITGIIGAILGGCICAIPWVLMYVYGNMILSPLATLIAFGAVKGYYLCQGKTIKQLPMIIIILSISIVSVATLVIIPLLLLMQEGYTVNFQNLKVLYTSSEFSSAIIKDYVISLIFTVLGISGVIHKIKKELSL